MIKVLREYQKQAIKECWSSLKANDEPVLLMSSVGSGKSLMLSDILLTMEKAGKRALCIVNNAELVRNNAATFKAQGGNPSIYCAALDSKDCNNQIVFGTPQSVLNGIKKQDDISKIIFNLIVADEAHVIDHLNSRSSYMRILRYFKGAYSDLRILGATGSNFRFKGTEIVGENCFFKTQVGNITTAYLIEHGYLTKPTFTVEDDRIDFSSVKINSMGQFNSKQLETVIEKNTRLTEVIMKNLIIIMKEQNRFGCFIFSSTRRHAEECLSHLPPNESALITGETPQKERIEILDKARSGEIRYLVNIAVLTTGVDVAPYDTLLFARPTESLVLMVQMIGRVLRLAPDKKSALIIDCSGNIERHSDWDDPVLLESVKQTRDPDEERPFKCYTCGELNGLHARRCVGVVNNKRCDFYFTFKECHACKIQNDTCARFCRECNAELIDPNTKLSLAPFNPNHNRVQVKQASYKVVGSHNNFMVMVQYECTNGLIVHEHYKPCSEKAKNVFYGKFIRHHIPGSSKYYKGLHNISVIKHLLTLVKTPHELIIQAGSNGYAVKKKIFHQS